MALDEQKAAEAQQQHRSTDPDQRGPEPGANEPLDGGEGDLASILSPSSARKNAAATTAADRATRLAFASSASSSPSPRSVQTAKPRNAIPVTAVIGQDGRAQHGTDDDLSEWTMAAATVMPARMGSAR